MEYARSVDKRGWNGDKKRYNIFFVEDFQTEKGLLSVWSLDQQDELDTALAIVMTRDLISDVYVVRLDDKTIRGSLRNFTPNEGESKWTEMNNLHYDMHVENLADLKWLIDYAWDAVTENICFRTFTKKELKDHLKKCVQQNKFSKQTLDGILNSPNAKLDTLKGQIRETLKK